MTRLEECVALYQATGNEEYYNEFCDIVVEGYKKSVDYYDNKLGDLSDKIQKETDIKKKTKLIRKGDKMIDRGFKEYGKDYFPDKKKAKERQLYDKKILRNPRAAFDDKKEELE